MCVDFIFFPPWKRGLAWRFLHLQGGSIPLDPIGITWSRICNVALRRNRLGYVSWYRVALKASAWKVEWISILALNDCFALPCNLQWSLPFSQFPHKPFYTYYNISLMTSKTRSVFKKTKHSHCTKMNSTVFSGAQTRLNICPCLTEKKTKKQAAHVKSCGWR